MLNWQGGWCLYLAETLRYFSSRPCLETSLGFTYYSSSPLVDHPTSRPNKSSQIKLHPLCFTHLIKVKVWVVTIDVEKDKNPGLLAPSSRILPHTFVFTQPSHDAKCANIIIVDCRIFVCLYSTSQTVLYIYLTHC